MQYSIWHVKKPNFGFGKEFKFPDDYDKVAIVNAKNNDDAFMITNHIDSDWTKNSEVIQLFKQKCRSTSVGDVVVDEDNVAYRCENVGWEMIS